MKEGERYRVKRTPILRQYGFRVGGSNPADGKAWPGEVGTVVIFQGNGWQGMQLEFPRGRTRQVGTLYSDSTDWEIDLEILEDLVKVKK